MIMTEWWYCSDSDKENDNDYYNYNDNAFCLPLVVLIYSIDMAEQMPETNISKES